MLPSSRAIAFWLEVCVSAGSFVQLGFLLCSNADTVPELVGSVQICYLDPGKAAGQR